MAIAATYLFLSRYSTIVTASILCYDYVLTFALEVELFWRRPFCSPNAILFYLIRYMSILGMIPVVLSAFLSGAREKLSGCGALRLYGQIYIAGMTGLVSIWLLSRTHLLYERNCRILCLLLGAGCGLAVNSCVQFYLSTRDPLYDDPDCHTSVSKSQGLNLAVLWAGVMVFEGLVFILTVRRTAQLERRAPTQSRNLWHTINKGGSLYFLAMTLCNVATMLTFLLASEESKSLLADFSVNLASVLVTRMMLDLRSQSAEETDGLPKP